MKAELVDLLEKSFFKIENLEQSLPNETINELNFILIKNKLKEVAKNQEYCLNLINNQKTKFCAQHKCPRRCLKLTPIISSNLSSALASLFLLYILEKNYGGAKKGLFYFILILIPLIVTFVITFIGFILIDTKLKAFKIASNWALGSFCTLLGSLMADNILIACAISIASTIVVILFVKFLADIYYCTKERGKNGITDEYSLESMYDDESIENNENHLII